MNFDLVAMTSGEKCTVSIQVDPLGNKKRDVIFEKVYSFI